MCRITFLWQDTVASASLALFFYSSLSLPVPQGLSSYNTKSFAFMVEKKRKEKKREVIKSEEDIGGRRA
jgi:hypothetical protein